MRGQTVTPTMLIVVIAIIVVAIVLLVNGNVIFEIIGNLMDTLADFVTTSFMNIGKR